MQSTVHCRACEALCQCLPDQLKDDTFDACLKDDKSTKHWISMLLKNLDNMTSGGGGGGGGQPGQGGPPTSAPGGLNKPPLGPLPGGF